jgi:hypothetical protein
MQRIRSETGKKTLQSAAWPRERAATTIQIVMAALIVLAGITNVVQFYDTTSSKYGPLTRQRTPDLTKIAEASPDYRAMYSLFFEMGRRYPGSTVLLAQPRPPGSEFKARMLSFGRAAHVAWAPLNAEQVLSDFDYTPYIVAQDEAERSTRGGPFVIAATPDAKAFLVVQQGRKTILVDLALVLQGLKASHD